MARGRMTYVRHHNEDRNEDRNGKKKGFLNRHVTNSSKHGEIHLSIYGVSRFNDVKSRFPSLKNSGITHSIIFCEYDAADPWRKTSSKKKYTEHPDLATCPECLSLAKVFGYGHESTNLEKTSSKKLRLSERSINNIPNWIPANCEINISSKGIALVDELTEERFKELSIKKAAILAAEKCFKPFSSDSISKNESCLSNDIYDYDNNKYSIQGLNFDKDLKIFNGFILKDSNNKLSNITFKHLLLNGYHFFNGSPCGDYVKDRKRFVDSEIDEGLGIDIMNVL